MEEIWKDIVGFEGKYMVSNLGKVKSCDWQLIHKSGKTYLREGRILKRTINHNGYLRVGIVKNKKQEWFFVHRLVWEAFNGPIPEGMQVNHINEIKTDNRLENLNLMTPKENSAYGTGRKRSDKKRKKPVTQILPDGTEFFTFFSVADAEIETGIPNPNITKCCKGIRKTAGGYMWKYANQQGK